MNDKLVKSAVGTAAIIDEEEQFSGLCYQIKESIIDRKPIQEKALLDFSRLTCQLLYNGISKDLPYNFTVLSERAEDYWHYYANKDADRDLSYSYVRVYQITSMVNVFVKDKHRDKYLFEAMEKSKKHMNLLKQVYQLPGITHKGLSEQLGISPSMLSHRTAQLEEQGFLFARRIGKNKYYSLSNLGINLYKRLIAQEIRKTAKTTWTSKRVSIIAFVLLIVSRQLSIEQFDAEEIIEFERELDKYDDDVLLGLIELYIKPNNHNSRGDPIEIEYELSKSIDRPMLVDNANA